MEFPFGSAIEKRVHGWLAEPWLLLQRIFMGLCAATMLGAIGGGVLSFFAPTRARARVSDSAADGAPKAPPSWDYYASAILKRNLFGVAAAPAAARAKAVRAVAAPAVHKPTLAELAADLALVGIVDNGGPQAAIMSKKTKDVSYVSVGGKIGDITVAAIDGNRVKLAYEGETMELSL